MEIWISLFFLVVQAYGLNLPMTVSVVDATNPSNVYTNLNFRALWDECTGV